MLVNGAVIKGKGAETVKGRSAEETEQIRVVLRARFEDLNTEYEDAVAQNQKLRLVEIGDAAGDDQADSGSKTAERDAASSLIRTLLDRRTQAEHALQRLDDGTYGNCEGATSRSRPSGSSCSPRPPPAWPASPTASAARPEPPGVPVRRPAHRAADRSHRD